MNLEIGNFIPYFGLLTIYVTVYNWIKQRAKSKNKKTKIILSSLKSINKISKQQLLLYNNLEFLKCQNIFINTDGKIAFRRDRTTRVVLHLFSILIALIWIFISLQNINIYDGNFKRNLMVLLIMQIPNLFVIFYANSLVVFDLKELKIKNKSIIIGGLYRAKRIIYLNKEQYKITKEGFEFGNMDLIQTRIIQKLSKSEVIIWNTLFNNIIETSNQIK